MSAYHVVALTVPGYREVVCIVHGHGGLPPARPDALARVRGIDDPSDRPLVHIAHHARGGIGASVSTFGAQVRDATPDEVAIYEARCRAHRASLDCDRTVVDGHGAVDFVTALAMAQALDAGDADKFARLAVMNRHPFLPVEGSTCAS